MRELFGYSRSFNEELRVRYHITHPFEEVMVGSNVEAFPPPCDAETWSPWTLSLSRFSIGSARLAMDDFSAMSFIVEKLVSKSLRTSSAIMQIGRLNKTTA